jgi:hypothetical protein
MITNATSAATQFNINARDIITLTARLAQVLAEEVDLLKAGKVKPIEGLQEEKLFIIDALDTYKKLLNRHPELSDTIPSRDKKDLEAMVEVFNDVLEENHRRLQMAKEVNQQVVKAIREVVTEHAETPYYNTNGTRHIAPYERMSVTLNQTV